LRLPISPAAFYLQLVAAGLIATTAHAQQQPLHFVPFTLTVERANALADLPLSPSQRSQLLALIQQWSVEQDSAQQAADLQKQVATLKGQIEELQKPKPAAPVKKDEKP
jgi:TolA-binding protein